MNPAPFQCGDQVEMTPEAVALKLHIFTDPPGKSRTGEVVHTNIKIGTVTVLMDGLRQNRVFLERFWRKRELVNHLEGA